MLPGLVQNLLHVFGAYKVCGEREPGANQKCSDQVEAGEDQEGGSPMPVRGDYAGEEAAEKSADHGSGYVGGHGAAYAASGPFFVYIGEHDRDHSGHEKALGK